MPGRQGGISLRSVVSVPCSHLGQFRARSGKLTILASLCPPTPKSPTEATRETPANTHMHAFTYTCTYTHAHSLQNSLQCTLTYSHSCNSHSHTLRHTCTNTRAHTHTHTFPRVCTHTCTLTHPLHTVTLSSTHMPRHAPSCSHVQTHTPASLGRWA